ncbi:MAG TPA: hypothetical protein DIW27_03030, partial [Cytophagales bacterium]|nr:hypothetical protein [Cytophagales bacterium]
ANSHQLTVTNYLVNQTTVTYSLVITDNLLNQSVTISVDITFEASDNPCCLNYDYQILDDEISTLFGNGTPGNPVLVSNQNIYMGDYTTLLIDNSVNNSIIFQDCNFSMGRDAKIDLAAMNNLTFRNYHLYACNEMWMGIEAVNNSSTLTILDSWIEDAQRAVYSVNCTPFTIQRNLFENNYNSLVVRNCSQQHQGRVYENNIFTYNSPLPEPYPGDYSNAGIVLSNIADIFIGNSITATTANSNDLNQFSYLKYGIYSTESQFKIFGNSFENMETEKFNTAIYSNGHNDIIAAQKTIGNTIWNSIEFRNFFSRCSIGIELIDPNPPTPSISTEISFNQFQGLKIGINVVNGGFTGPTWANGVRIRQNRLRNTITGIKCTELNIFGSQFYSIESNNLRDYYQGIEVNNAQRPAITRNFLQNSISDFTSGIRVNGSVAARVTHNGVWGTSGVAGPDNSLSVGIHASTSPHSLADCNYVENHAFSIATSDVIMPFTLKCNTMHDGKVGYGQFYGAIGEQLSGGQVQDNRWTGTTFTHLFNAVSDGTQSLFNYRVGPDYWPFNITNFGGSAPIFTQLINPAPSYNCSCNYRTNEEEEEDSLQVDLDSVAVEFYSILADWVSRIDTSAYSIDSIHQKISDYHFCRTLNDTIMFQNADSLIQAKYLSFSGSNVFQLSLASAMQDYALRQAVIDSSLLYNSLSILSAITESDSIDMATKSLLTLKANMYLRNRGDTAYTEAEFEELRAIAVLCPARIGFSVYEARAILWLCLKEVYGSDCEFFSPIQSKSTEQSLLEIINKKPKDKNTNKNLTFCLYPNPSNGNITLECLTDQPAQLDIFALDGRMLIRFKNVSRSEELSDLSNVMYLYTLRNQGRILESGKLVIINQ